MGILIVDDLPDNRLPLQSLLRKAGFTDLWTAESAHDAFHMLGMDESNGECGLPRPAFDAILMDITMPDLDGIEACRRIKARERLRDIPIIMVSSLAESKDFEAAFAAGAMDYVVKPINMVELLVRLRSALALKGELDCRKQREQELLERTRQLEEANQQLQLLSSLDSLTRVPNRRHFDESLQRAWKAAARTDAPLSLLLLDLDHFKRYNDIYGHQCGDDCLRQVAQTLTCALRRPTDLLARYGGEEFAVILADTDARGAAVVAGTLRSRVEALEIVHADSSLREQVTISIGVATARAQPGSSSQSLLRAADQALYEAKRHGRNRVVAVHDQTGSDTPRPRLRRLTSKRLGIESRSGQ
jgi:diguanylate cyclase (GGDEF)-like protein